ncbi:unnamed protein product [Durusdinium trenchii]|uniref:Uncharacterized protein n=1 Tax=Durusdinium trenchii TaxID=1381693 RepID=A0ABP0MK96_9DINO
MRRSAAEPLAEKTSEVDEERALKERVRLLRGQRDELQAKLQRGARQENEVLTAKVLAAQQEFLALQREFKTMKEEYNQRLEGLRLALEEQQIAAEHSSRRVICAEDLVKFHQEQSRLMTSHWRQQCQMKDESIRNLNRQLIEYSTDWQHLGHQRQTEAGLSHEHFCLEDRHRRLLEHQQLLGEHTERLEAQLAEVQTEERSLREELAKSAAAPLEEAQLEEALAERQTQTLEFLRAQRRGYEEEAAAKRSLPGCAVHLARRAGRSGSAAGEDRHGAAAHRRGLGAHPGGPGGAFRPAPGGQGAPRGSRVGAARERALAHAAPEEMPGAAPHGERGAALGGGAGSSIFPRQQGEVGQDENKSGWDADTHTDTPFEPSITGERTGGGTGNGRSMR